MEDFERKQENFNRATECQSCCFERTICLQVKKCSLCTQEEYKEKLAIKRNLIKKRRVNYILEMTKNM